MGRFSTFATLQKNNLYAVMEPKYLQKIAEKLSLTVTQTTNVYNLQAEGATIPYMARYRKEATGNLDEVAIANAVEEIDYFTDLHKRKVY